MYGGRARDSTRPASRSFLRWCTTVAGVSSSAAASCSTAIRLPSASRPTMRSRDASDNALSATRRSGSISLKRYDRLRYLSNRCRAPRIGGVTPERLIGPHIQVADGLIKAAQRATEIGATAVQIFTDNPTAWRRKEVPPRELAAFREHLASAGIGPLAVHAPYLVNLCGPNEDFWAKSVATMTTELTVGASYGASFVVMHIGSHRGLERAEGIERMATGIKQVLDH